MMPVRQKRKNCQGSRQTFWRTGTHCPQPHGGGTDTYEARADYRRNLAGTMRAQGKSWAEIAAAVGGQ
jgi:hypothetical protein